MGTLLAFLLGYALGGQSGDRDIDHVVDSYGTIRDSDQFAAFVMVARSQVARTLREVAGYIDIPRLEAATPDLVDQVRLLVERG